MSSTTSHPPSVGKANHPDTTIKNESSSKETEQHRSGLHFKLVVNPWFWGRLILLFVSGLLLCLSAAYCIAQIVSVDLQLIQECTPMTSSEIWHHSYLSGLQSNGDVQINAKSQYGLSNEPCFTTNSYEINTDDIWYGNYYKSQWKNINFYCIVFALMALNSLYIGCVLFTNVITDGLDFVHGRLHTKSEEYRKYVAQWQVSSVDLMSKETKKKKQCVLVRWYWNYVRWYSRR